MPIVSCHEGQGDNDKNFEFNDDGILENEFNFWNGLGTCGTEEFFIIFKVREIRFVFILTAIYRFFMEISPKLFDKLSLFKGYNRPTEDQKWCFVKQIE